MNLPRGRRDDLLTTKLDDEVVVYDPETKRAHSLNRLAVAVWNHSDSAKTVADLQQKVSDDIGVPIDHAAVLSALRKLERAHLLLGKVADTGPMTRREILRKGGKLSAAVAVTPLIVSALVPVAAAAASPSHVCSPGGICGAVSTCGATGACVCFLTVENRGFCHLPESCGGLQSCSSTLQCPTGMACVVTCCGAQAVCIQGCPAGQGPAQVLHGATTIGVLA
jgi:hypothetical protein